MPRNAPDPAPSKDRPERDDERDTCAAHDPAEDILPELVESERVAQARALKGRAGAQFIRRIGSQLFSEEAENHEEHEHDEPKETGGMLPRQARHPPGPARASGHEGPIERRLRSRLGGHQRYFTRGRSRYEQVDQQVYGDDRHGAVVDEELGSRV